LRGSKLISSPNDTTPPTVSHERVKQAGAAVASAT
jgi:hypothetical protein